MLCVYSWYAAFYNVAQFNDIMGRTDLRSQTPTTPTLTTPTLATPTPSTGLRSDKTTPSDYPDSDTVPSSSIQSHFPSREFVSSQESFESVLGGAASGEFVFQRSDNGGFAFNPNGDLGQYLNDGTVEVDVGTDKFGTEIFSINRKRVEKSARDDLNVTEKWDQHSIDAQGINALVAVENNWFQIIGVILFWYFSSMMITGVNKYVFDVLGFTYPLLVTFVHFTMISLVLQIVGDVRNLRILSSVLFRDSIAVRSAPIFPKYRRKITSGSSCLVSVMTHGCFTSSNCYTFLSSFYFFTLSQSRSIWCCGNSFVERRVFYGLTVNYNCELNKYI